MFSQKFNQYALTVIARVTQIMENILITETVCPVDPNVCVDVEILESSISLGFLAGVASYESVTHEKLR